MIVLCIIVHVFSSKTPKLRYPCISTITLNNPINICIYLMPSLWLLLLTTNLSVKAGVAPYLSSLWAVHHHSILGLPQTYIIPLILYLVAYFTDFKVIYELPVFSYWATFPTETINSQRLLHLKAISEQQPKNTHKALRFFLFISSGKSQHQACL